MGYNQKEAENIAGWKIFITKLFVLIIFIVYTAYLASLQITNSDFYNERVQQIIHRQVSLLPQRGEIYDRERKIVLAGNVPSFVVTVTPSQIADRQQQSLFYKLAQLLNMPQDEINAKIPAKLYGSRQSIVIKDNIDFNTIVKISENIEQFPGVDWYEKAKRSYSGPQSLAHIIGYTGPITNRELQTLYNLGYDLDSTIGKSGVEKSYDIELRGKKGFQQVMVDAYGRNIPDSSSRIETPKNGSDIVLTIDTDIQSLAEKALGERLGSVLVLKPTTGEILAMVSFPFYNANIFNQDNNKQQIIELQSDDTFPFLNRSIQSVYSPASSFKVLMSAAILDSRQYSPRQTVFCPGYYQLGNRLFHCHAEYGHGHLNLISALAQSCNIYFGRVGVENLGIDIISATANKMGLGLVSGIDIDGEVAGIIPTPQWKEAAYNVPWVGGDTLNVSIGQGAVAVTPLQMANMMAMIINDGVIYRPHLVKELRDAGNGRLIREIEPEVFIRSGLDKSIFPILRRNMREVIGRGTARYVITTKTVNVAGKTGTGEVGGNDEKDWSSWFVAYAPYELNNIEESRVVVVQIESTNKWEWWAPKAADMIIQGIFARQDFSQVLAEFRNRWYLRDYFRENPQIVN